ncbi:MAG: hypothetical protein GXP28_00910 [Planctomycetes bacterium]|nr:hypothetical protein [Planctomycetota bacterium]
MPHPGPAQHLCWIGREEIADGAQFDKANCERLGLLIAESQSFFVKASSGKKQAFSRAAVAAFSREYEPTAKLLLAKAGNA